MLNDEFCWENTIELHTSPVFVDTCVSIAISDIHAYFQNGRDIIENCINSEQGRPLQYLFHET